MMTPSSDAARFYLSLPRLLSRIAAGRGERGESNYVEAWTCCIGFYVVTYSFLFMHLATTDIRWLQFVVASLLLFLVWVVWLLVFYVNAVVIRSTRPFMFSQVSPRHAQHVMLAVQASALAVDLARSGGGFRVIGLAWLIAAAANLIAALLLKLRGSRNDAGA